MDVSALSAHLLSRDMFLIDYERRVIIRSAVAAQRTDTRYIECVN